MSTLSRIIAEREALALKAEIEAKRKPKKKAAKRDENEYSFADEPVQVELSEDDPEGYYEDIDALKAKDSTKDFEKNTFGFKNHGFQ